MTEVIDHISGFSVHTPDGTFHKDECDVTHEWDVTETYIIHTIRVVRKDNGQEVMRWPSMCIPKGLSAMAISNEVRNG